ncbi:MAG: glycoside hydrolase/phage tail family protein [Mangrovicoccus sp.]|nr:glycoside hydrolase/phage tail family protein [Mangrovicoccus sp.]
MATLVLSAAGGAAGAALGGSVLGVGAATIGRAIGAGLGRVIDQKLLGTGSEAVERGRVERFRLNGASEGSPIPYVFGRTRVSGQVIWASRFSEEAVTTTTGGGKGLSAPSPTGSTTTSYIYRVSLAIALCEGEISHVARIWADGEEIADDSLNMRVYRGSDDQQPDAKIAAIEGSENTPAYRGTAYVVFDDLDITRFGNRVPQFNFELVRPKPAEIDTGHQEIRDLARAVAMIPGTGEFSLATQPVYYDSGFGVSDVANVHAPGLTPDLTRSLRDLGRDLPRCNSVSLVVSWFGDDLRCGTCQLRPLIEQRETDGSPMPWSVAGWGKGNAGLVPRQNGRPVYGGTPADAAVVQSITALRDAGKEVLFYPFILMDQLPGNTRPDPWSSAGAQPELPWRGRITLSKAPGQPGSPDGSAAASAEVAAFFGSAQPSHFTIGAGSVSYSGPQENSLRRFILHYAALCKAAGGVSAFCIGSEMRALTQIRGPGNSFPAVAQFIALLQDVRAILGPDVKLSYAADWSEYFGYSPGDGSGDHFFHLDPLWAHPETDFIGIDNYMRISDWRDGSDHLDADIARSIYDLDYLKANVAGGEGYDWFYPDEAAARAQNRQAISDGAYGEPWVFRYKDLRNWWGQAHYDRPGGQRASSPTAWVPRSKPIWFTEYGAAALDKSTNQPNKFLDPKSSESQLPRASNGLRDDFIQVQYLRAMSEYWGDGTHNPSSPIYGGAMVDMSHAHIWAWDARPYPYFPAQSATWSDGDNYERGHWLNGRASARSLASVVAEICRAAGIVFYDVSELYGIVRGYHGSFERGARAVLQELMTVHGFDAMERNGVMVFRTRLGREDHLLEAGEFADPDGRGGQLQIQRASEHEGADRLRLGYVEADGIYGVKSAEAAYPDAAAIAVSQSETAQVLTPSEARKCVERWLSESRLAREVASFALPPSRSDVRIGDIVSLTGSDGARDLFRVDRVEADGARMIEAVRVESSVYEAAEGVTAIASQPAPLVPGPVFPVFLDLPILPGSGGREGAWLAVTANPWPGAVALYSSPTESGFRQAGVVEEPAIIGQTLTPLQAAQPGLIDRGAPLELRLSRGSLTSQERAGLLAGGNAMAIGDGHGDWEIFQFERAELIGPLTYAVSGRLRGQLGTDAIMPETWPAGSIVVLLGPGLEPLDGLAQERESQAYYRIGPAQYAFNAPLYVGSQFTYEAVALRPYAPVHLRMQADAAGNHRFEWIRRSRVDGDLWTLPEIPLGEGREAYLLRLSQNGALRLETSVNTPDWQISAADRAGAGIASGSYSFEVAQLSDRYGPGPFRRIAIDV